MKRITSPETLKSIIDFLVWKIGILISHDGKMIKQFDKKLFVSRIKNFGKELFKILIKYLVIVDDLDDYRFFFSIMSKIINSK